jgi:hypothetical protein
MKIHLVMITYNRLAYTRLALPRLLADPSEDFDLTVWDNASGDGTREYLRDEVKDPRIKELVLSDRNVGQVIVLNTVWGSSTADLVGKVDNDCLVSPGWTRTLAKAHEDIPRLGAVACWHFRPEDFDEERARHKIQAFGEHRIFRHANTGGSGFLIKRAHFQELGPLTGPATTAYWYRMGMAGYIVGFYYPLIYQEHLEDPLSPHSMITDEASFQASRAFSFGASFARLKNLDERLRRRELILRNMLEGPYDPRAYLGWRGKVRRAAQRVGSMVWRMRRRLCRWRAADARH